MAKFPEPSILKGGYPRDTHLQSIEDQFTRLEFAQFYPQIQGWMASDHNADGTHNHSRHESVTTALGVQEFGRSVTLGVSEEVLWYPSLFAASGTMTWQPTAAEMVNVRAAIVGGTLSFSGRIELTDVGGVASTELRIVMPFDQVGYGRTLGWLMFVDAGGVETLGFCETAENSTYLALKKLAGAVWTITAGNNTTVDFNFVGPVKDNPL